jgi:hypothetical protein
MGRRTFGRTRGRLSKVRRPIRMGCPVVSSRNFFKSSGRYQGSVFFAPITRSFVIATIMDIFI